MPCRLSLLHDWCDQLGSVEGVHIVVARHSQGTLELCENSTPNSSVNNGHGNTLPTVFLAPEYLPLPALAKFSTTIGDSGSLRVRHPSTKETIAVIVGAMRAETLTGGANVLIDDLLPESDIVDLDPHQVFEHSEDSPPVVGVQDDWFRSVATLSTVVAVRADWARWSAADLALPLWFVKKMPSPLGAFARVVNPAESASIPLREAGQSWSRSDIDVVAVTTDRYRSVRELVRSIRRVLGADVGITVAVQTRKTSRWDRVARRHRATFLYVEHDLGLSEARNVAVRATKRPLVFLMDDDFHLDERCRLDAALALLDSYPEISVLGGNLLDVDHWRESRQKEMSQGFAMKMLNGPPHLLWLRLEDAPRLRHYLNPTDYVEYCDIVDNFALIRRDHVFDQGIWWNEDLKIGAEHQDFYLRLNQNHNARIARTNSLKVRNVRIQSARFRRLRNRTDKFFPLFFEAWNLLSFTIIGERTRVRATDGGHAYFGWPHFSPVYVGKGADS